MLKSPTNRRQRIRWIAIATAILLIAPALRLNAAQKRKSHAVRKPTPHRRVRHSRRYRPSHRRFTEVRIQPERVKEIQQALVDAGTLHETPNGQWDMATRDAMKQFQKQNGFRPTGLPEAKPLMKLGLGPHPLPPGLGPQPSTQTEAESEGETQTNFNAVSSALKKPTTSN